MEDEVIEDLVEAEEMRKALGYSYPEQEEKLNIFAYFNKVLVRGFNPKTANLDKEELGAAKLPVRTLMDLEDYARMMGIDDFADIFHKNAQTILSTSLSKEGFLNNLAVTQKKLSETSLKNLKNQPKKKTLFSRGEQSVQ